MGLVRAGRGFRRDRSGCDLRQRQQVKAKPESMRLCEFRSGPPLPGGGVDLRVAVSRYSHSGFAIDRGSRPAQLGGACGWLLVRFG
jgi:hypothetical protein